MQITKLPRELALDHKDLLYAIYLKYISSLPILPKLPLNLAAGKKDLLYAILLAVGGSPNAVPKLPKALAAGVKDLLYSIFLFSQTAVTPLAFNIAEGFDISFGGCALSTEAVDAILAAVVAGLGEVATGTLDLSGGTNASPTDGILNTDYLSLIASGITVNIN